MQKKSKTPGGVLDLSKNEAIELLWRKGNLTWKLNSAQKQLYSKFTDTSHKIVVWNCSRQQGKSHTLIVLALEFCLKKAEAQVKYCAGQQKMVGKIIKPTIKKFIKEMPKDLQPRWDIHMGCYEFKNGSLLYLEGIDGNKADDLRGTPADLIVIDEAGFVDGLSYAINSVLLPMTSTRKGRLLIASSPPKSAGHDLKKIIEDAEFKGAYIKKDVYEYLEDVKNDPPFFRDRLPPEEVEELRKNTLPNDWDREYLCKLISNKEHQVIPEFTEEAESELVKEWPRPPKFDIYESMDLGTKDLTAVIFAYYDFRAGKIILEDEFSCHGRDANTSFIAQNILEKEKTLWTDINGFMQAPYRRVADTNEKIAQQDLARDYGLHFLPTRKDDKDAAINALRILIQEKKLIINPRCRQIIAHLKNATWNKSRKDFDRSPDSGHYDFIDALIYLVRNIDRFHNPYPSGFDISKDSFLWNPINKLNHNAQAIKSLFIRKK